MRALISGAALVLALATSVPTVAGADAEGTNPFEEARAAAGSLSFSGTVDVSWDDAGGHHSDQLFVRAGGGSFHVQGGSTLRADAGGARMVRRPGGDWDLLWTGAHTPAPRPHPEEKYDLVTVQRPEPTLVASRPTDLLEVREGAQVRERHFLDTANGLLLRRERLDSAGHATRVVAFSSIDFDSGVVVPASPSRLTDRSPDRVSKVSAPGDLPGGYRRVDAYRERGREQVVYSDGLYDLSVFRQRGDLAAGHRPASATPVRVGSNDGWAYGWPGGQVLVWNAGHHLYSLVSEAPLDHLVDAARALPIAGGGSLADRMRRVCRNLLEPLSA